MENQPICCSLLLWQYIIYISSYLKEEVVRKKRSLSKTTSVRSGEEDSLLGYIGFKLTEVWHFFDRCESPHMPPDVIVL